MLFAFENDNSRRVRRIEVRLLGVRCESGMPMRAWQISERNSELRAATLHNQLPTCTRLYARVYELSRSYYDFSVNATVQ